jgi:hypothetical protein
MFGGPSERIQGKCSEMCKINKKNNAHLIKFSVLVVLSNSVVANHAENRESDRNNPYQ